MSDGSDSRSNGNQSNPRGPEGQSWGGSWWTKQLALQQGAPNSIRSHAESGIESDVIAGPPSLPERVFQVLEEVLVGQVLRIEGTPKAQPRVKAYSRSTGRAGTYTPGGADEWKFLIQKAWRDYADRHMLEGPLVCVASFVLRRRQSDFRTGRCRLDLKPDVPEMATAKPDLDNLIKAVWDALNQQAFVDDSKIVTLVAEKRLTVRRIEDDRPLSPREENLRLYGRTGLAMALLTTREWDQVLSTLLK